MEEKILQTKKNGMVMLLLTLLGYAVTVLLFFYSIILLDESLFPGILLTILSIAYWVAGIFLLCGLKVLKPQEALVLTLFGDYIGTLKGQGFYWVNPFCTAVNPAAGTRLSQSGDVNSGETGRMFSSVSIWTSVLNAFCATLRSFTAVSSSRLASSLFTWKSRRSVLVSIPVASSFRAFWKCCSRAS